MRTDVIEERLVALFRTDLGHTTVSVDRDVWQALPLPPRFRFGYMPPVPVTKDDDTYIVTFCPELLAAVTAELDDEALDTYMNAVEAFVAGHIMLPEKHSDEVMAQIEDHIFEEAPDALAFMMEIEAQAIDTGIVARL